jgi:hypothetical protein
MRFLQGMVVGAVLIIGAAYVYDTGMLREGEKPTAPLVNWNTLVGLIARW